LEKENPTTNGSATTTLETNAGDVAGLTLGRCGVFAVVCSNQPTPETFYRPVNEEAKAFVQALSVDPDPLPGECEE
jgi:hypothetical protein